MINKKLFDINKLGIFLIFVNLKIRKTRNCGITRLFIVLDDVKKLDDKLLSN
jgi:hypothetical protein